MDTQIFSVIIPFYNAEKTIGRTLASLISSADYIQEIILVDDGSTDNAYPIIFSFEKFFNKLTVINNTGNKGPGPARKEGILAATTEWLTFCDSDDCLTPSSLRYIYNFMMANDVFKENWTVLIHSDSIYYESGVFTASDIGPDNNSCGGNFYRKQYLIDNNIYPHATLFQCEDEYFNEKLIKFITYCDPEKEISHIADVRTLYYSYPVYEVHHDIVNNDDSTLSFALSNWELYATHYHLQKVKYLTLDFLKYPHMHLLLLADYMDTLILVYYLCYGAINQHTNNNITEESMKEEIQSGLDFLKTVLEKDKDFLITYYKMIEIESITPYSILATAKVWLYGFEYHGSFEEYINNLD